MKRIKFRKGIIVLAVVVALVAAACKPWDNVTPSNHLSHVALLSNWVNEDQYAFTRQCVVTGQAVLWNPICSGAMGYTYLNYSSDGCSGMMPDKTYLYDFTNECLQHDFGYRNWPEVASRSGVSFNWEQIRESTDNKFRDQMLQECNGHTVWAAYLYCAEVAYAAYVAVRNFGVMHSSRI